MKKYPWGQKALRAMIATAVAFTPVVAVGGQATHVEAAQTVDQKIDQLASRFYIFYKNADETVLNNAKNKINGIEYTHISSAVGELSLNETDKAALVTLIKGVANVIYTKHGSASELSQAVKDFRTQYADEFNTLFDETNNVTADQLIDFVLAMEPNLEGAIMQNATRSNISYAAVIETAVQDTLSAGNFNTLQGKLNSIGLSVQKLFQLQEKLNNEVIDTSKQARSEMLGSAFAEKGALIANNGNMYELRVPIVQGSNVMVSLTTSIQWETSNPAIATFSGNVLTTHQTGTVDVFAKIDGITIAKKQSVSVTASGGSTGGGSTGGGSTGGGSVVTPPSTGVDNGKVNVGQDAVTTKEQTNSKGQKEKVTEVKVDKIADIVNLVSAQNKEIVLGVGALGANEVAKAEVPAKLFADVAAKEAKAIVNVQTDKASYKLPVAEIQAKLTEIAQKLGSSIDNIKIVIEMTKVNPPQGVTAVSDAVEFNVVATANGKSETITRFTQYVERELKGSKVFVPQRSVAVRVDANGNLVSVPTVFNGDKATVKSLTNSTYVVVENHKTFLDVDGGKTWAEAYVEALASKYIVKGETDQIYAPKENMTRAQFAVLLVRALGLPGETYDKRFKDVKGTEWFNENGELAAAVKHGIIQGKENGLFAPNAPITRAEAAVMLKRALELSFLDYDMTQLNTSKKVTDFKDAAHIKSWAKDGVEKMYQANIFTGRENERFVPNGYMTRAEIAKALVKFLASAKLMNDVQ
ncbi:S-layer homology domain-containing protein [Anoxybacillus flavithermus]|uniref:S-layer homology domain-containing protein n=1 Tax=Anoxybacillus flavithermus TaxID=33934 RepID=UPI0018663E3A|nr:S-layer homology domain-containing protein [Anoxybacillus flavithermus]MBE2940110.1 S-layer homology domain-containing protein [Anoxybacillus flavithermus]MBE2942863.1 S-layer homology domain-containing protein [Anoxybacillus flavithermus]MBE2951151.1 S-layer homology domain-containing protein [Anoxybacillus flavithermus]MBE2953851.1 S-layer homology domain-containing protein [Anoxybacillus flavithermus]MBE2959038.1 S-layer homology domain-containing protein [Anoxybacillus flavithermus]